MILLIHRAAWEIARRMVKAAPTSSLVDRNDFFQEAYEILLQALADFAQKAEAEKLVGSPK